MSGQSGTKRICEEIGVETDGNTDSAKKKTRVSENDDDEQEGKKEEEEEEPVSKMEMDLNVSFMNRENGIDLYGPIRGVIYISSDDDTEDELLVNSKDEKGKGIKWPMDLELRLGINDVGDSSSMGSNRRYSREEKGKDKIDDDPLSLSLGSNLQQRDPNFVFEFMPDQISEERQIASECVAELVASMKRVRELCSMTIKNQERERALLVAERARELARFRRYDEFWYKLTQRKKSKDPSNEAEIKLEEFSGLFSVALKVIMDRNSKQRAEELVKWTANDCNFWPKKAPSLLDLSLNVLAANADTSSSLDDVPEWLRHKLANLICDTHKMNVHIMELLCRGCPTEIRVKNCSWMTEKELVDVLGKSDLRKLKVLQLDNCGQCSFDDFICNHLAQSSNSLPCLGILSIRAAGRLSSTTLKPLLLSAPFLQSVNLSNSTFLTCDAIKIIAEYLTTSLKELYIDFCTGIDVVHSLLSLKKFERLEVLSVMGNQTVCDAFVRYIAEACGRNFKELNIACCVRLTNSSLEAIGNHCPGLCVLDISNLAYLTDLGLCHLANGCRSLKSLNITRGDFSDEAVAAFLETSGGSLKELSLNHVRKVSFNTAFSLVKCSKKLEILDLSWCREITDEALGFIVENLSSLKLLKLFGCSQITENFVLSNSCSKVKIVGMDMAPILENVDMLGPADFLLRHSPLEAPGLSYSSP